MKMEDYEVAVDMLEEAILRSDMILEPKPMLEEPMLDLKKIRTFKAPEKVPEMQVDTDGPYKVHHGDVMSGLEEAVCLAENLGITCLYGNPNTILNGLVTPMTTESKSEKEVIYPCANQSENLPVISDNFPKSEFITPKIKEKHIEAYKGKGKNMKANEKEKEKMTWEEALKQYAPNVKTMRSGTSVLFVYCYGIHRKRGMWANKPQDWPENVPFADPTNASPGSKKKLRKSELKLMYEHLREKATELKKDDDILEESMLLGATGGQQCTQSEGVEWRNVDVDDATELSETMGKITLVAADVLHGEPCTQMDNVNSTLAINAYIDEALANPDYWNKAPIAECGIPTPQPMPIISTDISFEDGLEDIMPDFRTQASEMYPTICSMQRRDLFTSNA